MEQKSLDNLEFNKILGIIASFAGSHSGKETILKLHPSINLNEIRAKLDEIEEYQEYSEAGLKLNPGGLRDIREILDLLRTGSTVLAPEDFLLVKANIETANSLKKALENHKEHTQVKKSNRLAERISAMPNLNNLYHRIEDCLDDRGQIKNSASPALSSIRREYSQTISNIEKELNAYISGHPDDVQESYFTVRNDRYVIPISASSQSRIHGIVHDQSASGQTVFIEPLQFLPINNRLAQLRISEREEIKKILSNLTALLYQSARAMQEQFETLTWIDVVKAKTDFAERYNAKMPYISDKGDLILHNAKHPLIHPNCVPLDISLSTKQKCIIITGPNGGGKTVSMKTVGINALLMQTGNYVTADSDATLPIFTQILSDIGETQSIEAHLSTFTAHLKRLKEMTDIADEHSLILIDEICVGTDPIEGGALASGFLKEVCGRGAYAIVTSHYDSLKNMAFTTEGFTNAAMEFDYDTFKPTFRFQMGIPGRSNALAMARSFGLPENILTDLVKVNEGERKDEKGLIEAIERERGRAEALRRTYVQKIASIRSKEKEIEETMVQLKEFRKTKRDKLTEEFTAELRNKMREIEGIISRLKKAGDTTNAAEAISKALEEARTAHKLTKESIGKLDEAQKAEPKSIKAPKPISAEELSAGTKVIWAQNLRTGTISRLKGKNKAEVDFDGLLMTIPLDELSISHHTNKKQETGTVYAPRPFIRSEIDVRGMRAEEAVDEVEAYLKQASGMDFDKVFIIHGKGTGALQKAITEYLKSSPWKKKFRYGRYGEGDLGVTVVLFKPEAEA